MLYTVVFTKRTKLFQRAYTIEGTTIYLKDTKRAKKRFLKSGIKNVIFTKEAAEDEVFGCLVKELYHYDGAFLFNYLEEMLLNLTSFLKMQLPVEVMAVSGREATDIALKYAKMVIVADKGEDEVIDGVNVIYTKKLKKLPDIALVLNKGRLPPLPGVPTVDISEGAKGSNRCISYENMSFMCSLLPYEINAQGLMYLLHTEPPFDFHITNMRKKSPPLFTFL